MHVLSNVIDRVNLNYLIMYLTFAKNDAHFAKKGNMKQVKHVDSK